MSRVLIVGSGAREHALAWKLAQSPDVCKIFVARGNAGTAREFENVPVAPTDPVGICRFVEAQRISLTVVGPEAPLAAGLADWLRARDRQVVGPSAAAARIESSKSFAKDLMARAGVPTAAYAVFDEPDDAQRYLADALYPLVVKADGLAAGKGVAICQTEADARAAVQAAMCDRVFGAAGQRIVVEEWLEGPEVSILALVDGARAVPLPAAQDHKRLGDGDTGPNTGGMGAYAPLPFLDEHAVDSLVEETIQPVVDALAEAGTPYRGILFAGLMLTANGPRVLEYNCRLGDPETQVVLPVLDGDLLPWLEAVAGGTLPAHKPVSRGAAVGVTLAAPGYPEHPTLGTSIHGLDDLSPHIRIFHAGTALNTSRQIVSAGGRVVTVVGLGDTVEEAARRAYEAPVWFEGMQRRGDIAWQGVRDVTGSENYARQKAEVGSS